jgi:hypothetical protein
VAAEAYAELLRGVNERLDDHAGNGHADDVHGDPRPRPATSSRPRPDPVAADAEPEPFRLGDLTARELMALDDRGEGDELAGPLVLRGGRTIVVGDTGHGKTTLAVQIGAAILTGAEVLGHKGAAEGPLMIVDLEQGLRSAKRTLQEAGLHDRVDVIYVRAPDGLALNEELEHLREFERLIAKHRPAVLLLDPYYKGHRGDANDERAVVDLMRTLDALRARYGFALILPAHPRKDPASGATRKLTLHDVAGSGAVTRGAEVVVAIERLSHGYARLRILKDRDGGLEVGDEWPLLFTRGEGFRLDPKEEVTAEELERRILTDTGDWRTIREWAPTLGIREHRAKDLLAKLTETGQVEFAIGPPGRSPKAQCYRTTPEPRAQSGVVAQLGLETGTTPTTPTSGVVESVRGAA